jgi:hypothetical protein
MIQLAKTSALTSPQRKMYAKYPRLAEHFSENPHTGRVTCQAYDQAHPFIMKTFTHVSQRKSPILLGELQDLEYYRVLGCPETLDHLQRDVARGVGPDSSVYVLQMIWDSFSPLERTYYDRVKEGLREIPMPFLRNYLLIAHPSGKLVFISDDHNHAAFAWALAQEAGVIKPEAAVLHVDEHPDNSPHPAFKPSGRDFIDDIAAYSWGELGIATFLSFAAEEKLLDPLHINFIRANFNRLDRFERTAFWDSDNPARVLELDYRRVSLELGQRAIDEARQKERSVIMDLDLDFFLPFYDIQGPRLRVNEMNFEEALFRVATLARQADLVNIATSPNYFLVEKAESETKTLLERIVNSL